MSKKLLLQFPALPATLEKADARLAIETVVKELLAKKTSMLPTVTVAVAPAGKEPQFVITFGYQRDPIMGATVSNIKVRYAKKGEVLTKERYPKLKLVELPAPATEEKTKAAKAEKTEQGNSPAASE